MSGIRRIVAVALAALTIYTLWRVGIGVSLAFLFAQGWRPKAGTWPLTSHAAIYVAAMLFVLLAHELGHRITAKQAGLQSSPPYLLPWPMVWAFWPLPAFGTLGAFVRIPELRSAPAPIRWRVAIAGPVCGGLAAVICLMLGALWSVPSSGPHGKPYVPHVVEWAIGNAAWHPVAYAGWLGTLLTGFNLIPLGFRKVGLDGWHLLNASTELSMRYRVATVASFVVGGACLL